MKIKITSISLSCSNDIFPDSSQMMLGNLVFALTANLIFHAVPYGHHYYITNRARFALHDHPFTENTLQDPRNELVLRWPLPFLYRFLYFS